MIRFLKLKRVQLAIIILLTLLAYSNIFQNKMVLDDNSFLNAWEERKSLSSIPKIIRGEATFAQAAGYRPVRSVLYVVYYQLFKSDTFWYHLHSILVHLGITVLVYFITRELITSIIGIKSITSTTGSKAEKPYDTRGTRASLGALPFITALLFGLHPIHTEAITFMTSGMDMTGALFFFASFYLYIRSKKSKRAYISSLALFFLAFFSYEPTVILPLLILSFDIYFRRLKRKDFLKEIRIYLPYILFAVTFLFIRFVILGRSPTNGHYPILNFYLTQLLTTKVAAFYIFLLLIPVRLSINHIVPPGIETFSQISNNSAVYSNQSVFDLEIVVSILLIVSLLFMAYKTFKKYPLISFGITWFFITLIPFANLVPQFTPMAERYVYIGSFGFALLMAILIQESKFKIQNYNSKVKILRKKNTIFLLFYFCILTLFALYTYLTFQRNKDWHDPLTLWTKVTKVYPRSALGFHGVGGVLMDEGKDFNAAVSAYSRALEIRPNFTHALYNLGQAYKETGREDLMLEEDNKALKINPNFIFAYLSIGTYYLNHGNIELAQEAFKKGLKADNSKSESDLEETKNSLSSIYNNMGVIYEKQNKLDEAASSFLTALSISPKNASVKGNLEDLVKQNPQLIAMARSLKSQWKTYENVGLSVTYPGDWIVAEKKNKITLISADSHFEIHIETEKSSLSPGDYLKTQTKTYGKLTKAEFTTFPRYKEVYVKAWDDKNTPKLQFFFFKGGKVVKVFVDPSEPTIKKVFDKIIKSIEIN